MGALCSIAAPAASAGAAGQGACILPDPWSTGGDGVGDNLILPAFRLAAWPQAYPLRTHAYAWAAHLVYGAAVAAAFEAQRRSTWAPIAAVVSARWATRRLPAPVRPAAARVLRAVREVGVGADSGAGVGAIWASS